MADAVVEEPTLAGTPGEEPTLASTPVPPVAEGGEATPDPAAAESTPDPAAAPAEDEEPKTEEPKAVVPEEYADFTLPEGVEISEATAAAVDATAKELGLTQEQAQKFAERSIKQEKDMSDGRDAGFTNLKKEWREEAAKDEEIGGPDLVKNMSYVKIALDKFATPELREALEKSGLGNHKEFLRLLYRTGRAVSEDNIVGGKAPDTKSRTRAEIIYNK